MKKILILMLLLNTPCLACEGSVFTGHDPSKQFCVSKKRMNWWSAHMWCQKQGYVLATPDRACNYSTDTYDYIWIQGQWCHNIMYLTPSNNLWFNFVYPSGKVAGTQWNQVVASEASASSEDYQALCDMSGG